jgi:uncharacterized protein
MKAKPPRLNQREIADFCKRHHIKKLSLFGSVLRNDFNEGSDVDVLIEFETAHIPGLIRLAGMERELTDLLGRKVDLRTPQDLSQYFRGQVLASARTEYAS